MEKENKDINSIFIEIRKNIDGEFLYSEKWTTDDVDSDYNLSSDSDNAKDFVELHELLMGISPTLSFADYLKINNMIKLNKKRVGDYYGRYTENNWVINLNDLLSFLEIKGYIKKKDFSYLLEDKFRKVLYKDFDEIIYIIDKYKEDLIKIEIAERGYDDHLDILEKENNYNINKIIDELRRKREI